MFFDKEQDFLKILLFILIFCRKIVLFLIWSIKMFDMLEGIVYYCIIGQVGEDRMGAGAE